MSGGESVKDGVSVEKKFGEEEQTKASSSFLTLWVGFQKEVTCANGQKRHVLRTNEEL